MQHWLQLLIVYAVVMACTVYSCALLLPRGLKVGAAAALARMLRVQPHAGKGLLVSLERKLASYASQQASTACGGCGSCADKPAAATPPLAQPVRWVQRDRH